MSEKKREHPKRESRHRQKRRGKKGNGERVVVRISTCNRAVFWCETTECADRGAGCRRRASEGTILYCTGLVAVVLCILVIYSAVSGPA